MYSQCVPNKICICGKCIWPIYELSIVYFARNNSLRFIYENAHLVFWTHNHFAHIIHARSIAMVHTSPFVVSIVLFKSRKKIRVLEKSPLFARWKNKAKLAVITSLGCIFDDRVKCILSILLMIIMWISKRNAYVGGFKTEE